ncbi:MAG TPA: SIMPL domain-containing protein [Limnobacter sp.]|nr:SIMPL domain-containing protein [Limnobacter sp.]
MSRSALYSPRQQDGMGLVSSLILALGVAAAGLLIALAMRDFRKHDQFIEVRGLAEEIVKSDRASWNIAFSAYGDTPQAASQAWTSQRDKLEPMVLSLGFDPADLRRQPMTVYENIGPNGQIQDGSRRWRAQGGIMIETAKVDVAEQAALRTDLFLNENIVPESSFVQFYFTDLNSIKPRMLKAATENAREAAETFAADSGVVVGELKTASQGLFSITSPLAEHGGENTLMKKVRVVTKVQYLME